MLIGLISSAISLPFIVKGEAWDETRYEYEPATGNLLKKIYPDRHQITYTYHHLNLPKRITYASGKWMERNYNNRLQTVATVYSSENTPNIYSTPNEFGTVCKVEDLQGCVYSVERLDRQSLTNISLMPEQISGHIMVSQHR